MSAARRPPPARAAAPSAAANSALEAAAALGVRRRGSRGGLGHPLLLATTTSVVAHEPVGFANSSGSLPPTTWLGSALLLSQVEGGLLALVVRVSRRAEPVRACLAAGAPASLEGARDPGTAP